MRTLQPPQAASGLRLAPEGARAARQLLPAMPSGAQTRALREASRALRSERPPSQANGRRGARRLPRRLLPRATVRGLRRDGSTRARVRPPRTQTLQHRQRRPRPQLAIGPRRDRHVRRRLCKLSSTTNRPPGRLRARGGSSTVEPRPSKAMMRVRFPSAASNRPVVPGAPRLDAPRPGAWHRDTRRAHRPPPAPTAAPPWAPLPSPHPPAPPAAKAHTSYPAPRPASP
jgi:hypothetical protein